MSRLSFAAAALALATIFSSTVAQLVYKDADGKDLAAVPNTVLLHSAGVSESVSFFYTGAAVKTVSVAKTTGGALTYFTVPEPIRTVSNGVTNVTVTFNAKNDVGSDDYTVSIGDSAGKSATISGKVVCAGFVIMEAGKVVSGDDGAGVTVGASGATEYDVKAVGTDGAPVNVDATTITYAANAGTYMEEVNKASTGFAGNKFTLALNEGRYGSGGFRLDFTNSAISDNGEVFETSLFCKQTIPASIPCMVKGGAYEINKSGLVKIPMYNLMKPPRKTPVKALSLSVGGNAYAHEDAPSDMSLPTQTIVFAPEAIGTATITCDGSRASVNGNGGVVTITGTPPKAPEAGVDLAVDFVESLQTAPGKDIITAKIIFTESSKKLLTKKQADSVLAKMCQVTGGSSCTLEKVVTGSAICDVAAHCPESESASCVSKLQKEFKSGDFQRSVGYTPETLTLEGAKVVPNEVVGGAGVGVTPGVALATWTIVLIAVVGAFAIILLIMLALWAVYRRNAEQSESDYSSSGPLGVPDPSDLLYEQSIVRDIYGRGDFPEGGPSAAAAAERAREADLREEFPRPPSSSAVSRGDAQTDDASSTYSV